MKTIWLESVKSVLRSFTSHKKEESPAETEGPSDATEDAERNKPLAPTAGWNRLVWDLRLFDPAIISPRTIFDDYPPIGATVSPGTYTIRLKVGTRTLTENLEVRPHPGLPTSSADLQRQFELLTAIHKDLSRTHEAVREIRDVKGQVKGVTERARLVGKGDGLEEIAKLLAQRLSAIEDKLFNPNLKADEDSLLYTPKLDFQFAALAAVVASADARPTVASVNRYAELKGQLTAVESELNQVFDRELGDFNRAVRDRELPAVIVTPKPKKGEQRPGASGDHSVVR